MVRIATRRQVCETWERQDICPNIVRRIQQLCQESRTCIPYMCGEGEYEVMDGKSTLLVSLNKHTCLCNVWQLTGIPCKHGIRAIIHARLDPHSFVSEWYSVSKYREEYSSGIRSIPDVEQWPDINMPAIKPRTMKRAIGRPSRERKKVDDEDRKGKRAKTIRCSKCNAFDHNQLTCKGGLTAKQKNKQKKQQHKEQPATTSQPLTRGRSRSVGPLAASQPF